MKEEYISFLEKEVKLSPLNKSRTSNEKQRIKCLLCGNVFEAIVKGKVNNYRKHKMPGCKKCTALSRYEPIRKDNISKLNERFEILQKLDISKISNEHIIKVKNRSCGHTFSSRYGNLLSRDVECPTCNNIKKKKRLTDLNEIKHKESLYNKSGFEKYKQVVYKLTRDNYKKYIKEINPKNLPRARAGETGYHLDHIVSVRFCFDFSIPAEVCADYRNLRMVEWKVNSKKWKKPVSSFPDIFHPYIKHKITENFINHVKSNTNINFKEYVDFGGYTLTLYNKKLSLGIYFVRLGINSEQITGSKKFLMNFKKYFSYKGIKVLMIFEDEWLNYSSIIIKKILHYSGINYSEKIYARKCQIKTIDNNEKNKFFNKFHVQGTCQSNINLGAYYGGELVASMTFTKPRISMNKSYMNKDGYWELSRFATHSDYRVIGIASKLLEHFKNNYSYHTIYSFADLRWSDGNLYNMLGFELEKINPPEYHYIINDKRYHRWGYRKDAIKDKIPEVYDPKLTEYEMMLKAGYDRVWDCGHAKFILVKE